jgi:hypothetical protein
MMTRLYQATCGGFTDPTACASQQNNFAITHLSSPVLSDASRLTSARLTKQAHSYPMIACFSSHCSLVARESAEWLLKYQ